MCCKLEHSISHERKVFLYIICFIVPEYILYGQPYKATPVWSAGGLMKVSTSTINSYVHAYGPLIEDHVLYDLNANNDIPIIILYSMSSMACWRWGIK